MSQLQQFFTALSTMIDLYSEPISGDCNLDELEAINKRQYEPFLLENYKASFANPDFCFEIFGDVGPALSLVFSKLTQLKDMTYFDHSFRGTFIDHLRGFEALWHADGLTKESVEKAIADFAPQYTQYRMDHMLGKIFCWDFQRINDVILQADLDRPDYLYHLNIYVDDNALRLHEHLKGMDQKDIDAIANQFINAYLRGYPRKGSKREGRRGMGIVGVAGMECVTKALILEMRRRGYKPFVEEILGVSFNKQFKIDHKTDHAIYLDEAYVKDYAAMIKETLKKKEEYVKDYSGILYFESFGEKAFLPTKCEHKYTLSDEQNALDQKLSQAFFMEKEGFAPEENCSFSIMGFPLPEIHEDFKAVFDEFIKINNLDNATYEAIQTKIITALDKGAHVHVKGRDGNETDIRVQLQPLSNPSKETGFFNSTADVNIPVGEVFTSPKLEGTSGLLHIKDIYMNGLNYVDLKIWFEDGYAVDYTCGNFNTREEGKKYVQENIFHPHDKLPLGEFAIGTNTLAYAVSRKYDIVEKLNVLFVEKMGPHFAVGDTCYARTEDIKVFNPDGKEIIARDNARSIRRKENDPAAYTYVHEDITIPYDDIGVIAAVTADGEEIPIIKDGCFALAGTEELNKPLK